ncbi:MAG: arsenate reductase ArsC [Chlorobi bacterium]|nr:arsenate reductase ArsC [Chlorobiota bacterium]
MKILFVCTGNSCRSQTAEGLLKTLKPGFEVFSAGVKPEKEISKYAVKVLKNIDIDISEQYPKDIEIFKNKKFDYIITFSQSAKNKTKEYNLKSKKKLHFEIDDPFGATGTEYEILKKYERMRDDILKILNRLYEPDNRR